jgi:hypothetical protein
MDTEWIANYEKRRHSKLNEPSFSNPMWQSSKYDFQSIDWRELQQLYLPEINMTFGQGCSSLIKLWKGYRQARLQGLPGSSEISYKINAIQRAMGVEVTHFEELEAMGEYDEEKENDESDEEWSNEDQVLKNEEMMEEDIW